MAEDLQKSLPKMTDKQLKTYRRISLAGLGRPVERTFDKGHCSSYNMARGKRTRKINVLTRKGGQQWRKCFQY